ncbi:MAG: sigma-70 family RNA polymerase sigma factor [Clostridia bacterium]|nr:sigma-70 family RNA polymerase sigma factor [Clostridia bacterium]
MENNERRRWLGEAMSQYGESLLRMCYSYLGDRSLAEDAVQETFLKAWKGFGRFRGESSERTWLMRIAINTCRDIRRGAWFRHIDRSVSLDQLSDLEVSFDMRDDAVTKAVMKLRPRLREAVLLRWYQGLSAEETAQALGISRSTAYERLNRAQAILKRELEEWYDEI